MKIITKMALTLMLISMAAPCLADDFPFGSVKTGDSAETQAAIIAIDKFESDPYCVKARGGGSSGKALGVYRDGKFGNMQTEFHSKEYMELDPAVKARWAYSLHNFMVEKGGGFANMQAQSLALAKKRQGGAPVFVSPGEVSEEAEDVTYVPYGDVEGWADSFFKMYASDKYSKLAAVWMDWFKNDAILDAVNIWGTYEAKKITDTPDQSSFYLGSDIWTGKTLDRYKRKVGPEGKLVGEKQPKAP